MLGSLLKKQDSSVTTKHSNFNWNYSTKRIAPGGVWLVFNCCDRANYKSQGDTPGFRVALAAGQGNHVSRSSG